MLQIFWIMICIFALVPSALAYIGPGPGLAMVGPLLGLIAGILIALAMVLAYPIRLYLKRRKSK